MVSISACHAEDPGSIPGRGAIRYSMQDWLNRFDDLHRSFTNHQPHRAWQYRLHFIHCIIWSLLMSLHSLYVSLIIVYITHHCFFQGLFFVTCGTVSNTFNAIFFMHPHPSPLPTCSIIPPCSTYTPAPQPSPHLLHHPTMLYHTHRAHWELNPVWSVCKPPHGPLSHIVSATRSRHYT